jgi:gliding motility-associated-like protein
MAIIKEVTFIKKQYFYKMKSTVYFIMLLLLLFFTAEITYSNDIYINDSIPAKEKKDLFKINTTLPTIKASGNQIYCPQTSINIVTDILITDPKSSQTETIYIQISTGYNATQDILELTGTHPKIISIWDPNIGLLKLTSSIPGNLVSYSDFTEAIKDVTYTNSSLKPTGNRAFSISLDKAGYLPSNQHYYEFVANGNIAWSDAKNAAEQRTYFGLKGYLATILSADEQQLIGEQLYASGWIGGSDANREGVWFWMTGPEKGIEFYYNLESTPAPGVYMSNPKNPGSSQNFMFWNRSAARWYEGIPHYEPDNIMDLFGFDEDYTVILDPPNGIKGAWSDTNFFGTSDNKDKPKGYIVEYGGMPNDPLVEIATSTYLTIPQITETTSASRCDIGNVTLEAKTNLGIINWYENETGGDIIGTGSSFQTPILSKTTTYYVETKYQDCKKLSLRTAVTATVFNVPVITLINSTYKLCGPGTITMEAKTSEGTLYWYEDPTGNSLISIGTKATRYVSSNTTFYVEAVNNNCSNKTRMPIEIFVYDVPIIKDQEVVICKSAKVTIDAQLTGMTYLWSTGEKTQTIEVNSTGIYTVEITKPAPENCTITETIKVIEHPAPEIKNIRVEDNKVLITLKDTKPYYEYSIDGIHYQASNEFINVPGGIQTAYVREENLCSIDNQTFIVLDTPKFFSPNNDDYNDVWEIKGVENYPEFEVTIFDRYGKFITKLNIANPSWDGTFNKNNLPASDYWYVLKIDANSPEKRGHFSLKR